jgi:hypothetical protein
MAREIGFGYQNSLDIAFKTGNTAASSAAVYALEYQNRGWNDWYLPSVLELEKVRDLVPGQAGCERVAGVWVARMDKRLVCAEYWSSTQSPLQDGEAGTNGPTAWIVDIVYPWDLTEAEMASGLYYHLSRVFNRSFNVLPIRAFGPMYQPGS